MPVIDITGRSLHYLYSSWLSVTLYTWQMLLPSIAIDSHCAHVVSVLFGPQCPHDWGDAGQDCWVSQRVSLG